MRGDVEARGGPRQGQPGIPQKRDQAAGDEGRQTPKEFLHLDSFKQADEDEPGASRREPKGVASIKQKGCPGEPGIDFQERRPGVFRRQGEPEDKDGKTDQEIEEAPVEGLVENEEGGGTPPGDRPSGRKEDGGEPEENDEDEHGRPDIADGKDGPEAEQNE